MRTVQLITAEYQKALEAYNKHYNSCKVCQYPAQSADDEITCREAEFLYKEYETLQSEAVYAEQVF